MLYRNLYAYVLTTVLLTLSGSAWSSGATVIAHRGASGYLPEHTLEAYALAYGMGADFIEQDLVMTRDGRFVALHDIHLEGTTDVEVKFPERHREDGRWYAADFTLAEVKTLSVHERLGKRFPQDKSHFEVPTFEEAIELIQGLNHSMGRNVGIYPELKQPTFHREAGFDVERSVLEILTRYGYEGPDARVYIQCFEAESLKRIRQELKSTLPLVQLISGHALQADQRTREGLKAIATYANGVGPDKNVIEKNPDFVVWAHENVMVVHPYTIRADDRPAKYATTEAEFAAFFDEYNVDGIFTDYPDQAHAYLAGRGN